MTWRERIVAARARGKFTKRQKDMALDWTTCAVGEQHAALPAVVLLDELDWPEDGELCRLGSADVGFAGAVVE